MTSAFLWLLGVAAFTGVVAMAAAPDGAPARVELRFANGGVELAGTLLQPPGDSRPAVMLIRGSGASGGDWRSAGFEKQAAETWPHAAFPRSSSTAPTTPT